MHVCVGMPAEALPQADRKGRLSYTVVSPVTGAKVEVLLKHKAFRVSKIGCVEGACVKCVGFLSLKKITFTSHDPPILQTLIFKS